MAEMVAPLNRAGLDRNELRNKFVWVGLDSEHGACEELEVTLGWSSGLRALRAQEGVGGEGENRLQD